MQGHVRKRHKPECAKRSTGKPPPSTQRQTRCTCDGSWQARYRLDGKFVERTFRTKGEAQDWLTQEQSSQLSGTHVNPRLADTQFGSVVQAWRESWPNRLSPTTAARYSSILANYLIPTFGTTPVGKIDHGVVQRYINKLAAERDPDNAEAALHAPGTVLNVYSVLRTAMSQGVRLGMVKVNPCTKIDLPRSPREEPVFLTTEEVAAVAEKIDGFYRVLVYTAAYTGLRAGELLALRRQDVDLLRGVLHVRRALKDVDGKQEFGPVKTESSRRTVSLPAFLRDMLTEHLTKPSHDTGPDALVFPSKQGKPLRHNLFYRRHFKPAVMGHTDKEGVYHPGALPAAKHGLRFHDLRHTCASLSIAAGAHPKLISTRLGHSSITITIDRYGHLFPSVEAALAEQLDALYRAAPAPSNVSEIAQSRT